MNQRAKLLLALLLVGITSIAALLLYSSELERRREVAREDRQTLESAPPEVAEVSESEDATNTVELQIFVPSKSDPAKLNFRKVEHEIAPDLAPINQATQVCLLVFQELAGLVPEQARVRQVFFRDEGLVVVDLSSETADQLSGSAISEFAVLRSIARSLIDNVPEVTSVRFLVGGQNRPTFSGHVSIQRPFL